MPAVRTPAGRASKACEGCRKGKTRCYPDASGACLRCNTLGLACSLQGEPAEVSVLPQASGANTIPHDCALIQDRVTALERLVSRLSEAVGLDARIEIGSEISRLPTQTNAAAPHSGQEPPILVIQHAVSEVDHRQESNTVPETIIDKGLLSINEANQLLTLFTNYYGRWITLREGDQDGPGLDFWGSPLLLCACCLIAIRHWSGQRARETADRLFSEAKSLLSQYLLQSPQPLAFFQAVLVLSLWSTSIGRKPLSIDSWMITGFAIQHSSASGVFSTPHIDASLLSESSGSVGKKLLWTRLCLSHLHACISIRRSPIIGKTEIDRITKIMPTQELSNFESRMVAELNLYWTIHENSQTEAVSIRQAQAALQKWKQLWSPLLDQPRAQFLEMGYRFAQLLIFEQSLNNKSAAVRESLISEMTRLSSAILQLAMETTDERTKFLTDHIYHMITFAAVTLARLLHKYETQLRSTQNIDELGSTILRTAQWLLSLGTDTHIGHIMGSVIEAMYRKLLPNANSSMQLNREPEYIAPDQAMFPELLAIGMEAWAFDWDAAVPDWQSIASDGATQASIPLSNTAMNEHF